MADDTLRIDERRGSFTGAERTTLNGGAGNDRITFDGSRPKTERLSVSPPLAATCA